MKTALVLLVAAAACGNNDNVIVGGVGGGPTTPPIGWDNIGSSIHGVATLYDSAGNSTGRQADVILMSDVPHLCARITAQRDYFRTAKEPYEALVMIVPRGTTCPPIIPGPRVGTFFIGRDCDEGTQAEIVAASGPQQTTPFVGATTSYIAVTDWSDTGGNATGSFNILFADPYGDTTGIPFYGRFKTSLCSTLDGTLLP